MRSLSAAPSPARAGRTCTVVGGAIPRERRSAGGPTGAAPKNDADRPTCGVRALPELGALGVVRVVERDDVATFGDILDADLLADLLADLDHHVDVLGQERLRVLPALAELLTFVGEPRARLLHDAELDADVEQRALAADALAVHDVELGLPE